MYKAQIFVTLKDGVLDPQGEAVKKSMYVMGYENINEVRIGKYIEILLEAKDKQSAQKELEEVSDKLLANPVMENYRVELLEVE